MTKRRPPPKTPDAWPRYVPHYCALLAGLGLDTIDPAAERSLVETPYLAFFIEEFARAMPFDAAFYAASYPDIAQAAARGEITDLRTHFIQTGYREGRLPHALAIDPDYYLARNPDLAGLGRDVDRQGLIDHFHHHGRFEGRTAHPAAETDAARWWQAGQRTPYRLAHRTIANAVIQAFRAPLVAGPPLGFRGGLVLGDTPADARLRHRRGGQPVDSFPPSAAPMGRLPGEYVYGGPYTDHFGHAMAEMIHRVLPARAVFDCRRLLFVGVGTRRDIAGFDALPPVMQAPLLFLGVDPADVTVIHDDRLVETLHVAQQGSDLTGGPAAEYLRMLGNYTPARLNALPANGPRRVYVSRSQLRHGGTVLGESHLERLLAAEGWHILHPQGHSLVEQMRFYHRAEAIIFAEGSACHGTELFGAGSLGHCVVLPCRNTDLWWIEATLRPRATRLDRLTAAKPLGTVVVDPDSLRPLANLSVSVMDLSAVAADLREFGLADLPKIDQRGYRRVARADLADYVAFHRAPGHDRIPGTQLIGAAELAIFEAFSLAAIG